MITRLVVSFSLTAAISFANAATIDFSTIPDIDDFNSTLASDYGSTADVDLFFGSFDPNGNGAPGLLRLRKTGFGAMGAGAFANADNDIVVIGLTAKDSSRPITLKSFSLAAFPGPEGVNPPVSINLSFLRVLDGFGTTLVDYAAAGLSTIDNGPAQIFSPNVSCTTCFIFIGQDWNVGVNHIVYEQAPVPVPPALLLLGSALTGISFVGRRRVG